MENIKIILLEKIFFFYLLIVIVLTKNYKNKLTLHLFFYKILPIHI